MHAVADEIFVFVAFVSPSAAIAVEILVDANLLLLDSRGKKRTRRIVEQFGGVDAVEDVALQYSRTIKQTKDIEQKIDVLGERQRAAEF